MALTEGLEISIVPLSQVIHGSDLRRIDSSFFTRAGLEAEATLRAMPHSTIGALSDSILSFGAYGLTNDVDYKESGIPFLRCLNIKNGFVSFSDVLYIDKAGHDLLHKSQVLPETVLLSMSGSIGNAAVSLPGWEYPINSNQDIAKIRPRDINPYYMTAFLGSRFGQDQMQRLPVGSVQQHIFLSMIETILIARLGDKLEDAVAALMMDAYATRGVAETAMAEAEDTLLIALGLREWSPAEPLTYTRPLASVAAAGRLDANYFAPKYEHLLATLAATGEACQLGEGLTTLIARGSQPIYADDGIPVINSKHVRTNRVLLDERNRCALPKALRIQSGDVLVNGTGFGTIGRAAPYLGAGEALPDNHVTIVRPQELDPLFLSVFLNTKLGQMQIERMISGSSGQIELYPDDIRKIVVWRAPEDVQSSVADGVRSSFMAEARSSLLLSIAKEAVEIGIEQGETSALAFIDQQREANDAPAL